MKTILFNTEMVRAILDGRKTVTRRVIDRDIVNHCDMEKDGTLLNYQNCHGDFINPVDLCRYKVNDILYVRETWSKCEDKYLYRAGNKGLDAIPLVCWRPSIHMPKEAARLFLKVTGVRVERLQDINSKGSLQDHVTNIAREGIKLQAVMENYEKQANDFKELWDSTIKKDQLQYYGWDANPYVWVIEFEVIDKAALKEV